MNSNSEKQRRQGAARIPKHIADAMHSIVVYLWNDEFTDYQARTKQERVSHVYRDLMRVRRFLERIGVGNE